MNKISKLLKKDDGSGSIEIFISLMLIILAVIIMIVAFNKKAILYVKTESENALALSNLSASLIDTDVYALNGTVKLIDINKAYPIYEHSLKVNLGLNDAFEKEDGEGFTGKVKIDKFIIYNIVGNNVQEITYSNVTSGTVVTKTYLNKKGLMTTPDGALIDCSIIYSKIRFTISLPLGIEKEVSKENSTGVTLN